MDISSHPVTPASPESNPVQDRLDQERLDLSNLKALIHQALEDGKITRQEFNAIRAAALADGKITDEECSLFSSLILEKVKTGQIKMEW